MILKLAYATWGDGFLKQLSQDLIAEFPEMKWFSKRNLEQIRHWHLFWDFDSTIAKQAASQLELSKFAENLEKAASDEKIPPKPSSTPDKLSSTVGVAAF